MSITNAFVNLAPTSKAYLQALAQEIGVRTEFDRIIFQRIFDGVGILKNLDPKEAQELQKAMNFIMEHMTAPPRGWESDQYWVGGEIQELRLRFLFKRIVMIGKQELLEEDGTMKQEICDALVLRKTGVRPELERARGEQFLMSFALKAIDQLVLQTGELSDLSDSEKQIFINKHKNIVHFITKITHIDAHWYETEPQSLEFFKKAFYKIKVVTKTAAIKKIKIRAFPRSLNEIASPFSRLQEKVRRSRT